MVWVSPEVSGNLFKSSLDQTSFKHIPLHFVTMDHTNQRIQSNIFFFRTWRTTSTWTASCRVRSRKSGLPSSSLKIQWGKKCFSMSPFLWAFLWALLWGHPWKYGEGKITLLWNLQKVKVCPGHQTLWNWCTITRGSNYQYIYSLIMRKMPFSEHFVFDCCRHFVVFEQEYCMHSLHSRKTNKKGKFINNYCHNLSCPGKQTRNNCWWTDINKGIKAWKTSLEKLIINR